MENSVPYSVLFNLESLMNFKVPRPDVDFEYHAIRSQDESRISHGRDRENSGAGILHERDLNFDKRSRQWNYSDEEVQGGSCRKGITEECYRAMLGEHILKYKRRYKNSSSNPTPPSSDMGISNPKSAPGSTKIRKFESGQHRGDSDHESEWFSDCANRKCQKTFYEPAFLDIGGVTYMIPPPYDNMAASLKLPLFTDMFMEDFYLEGLLDLTSLVKLMANDEKLGMGPRSQERMGEPRPQRLSLYERLKEMEASKSEQKFNLKISDAALNSFIPEGAAGNIQRFILSEGGVLQIYYVKVLEKGDTYEIIERSLPKKPKAKKDPSAIEREEVERMGKVWVIIAKRDIAKQHKIFTTFHRKQVIDAKRFSESCQREAKMKVSRSLKLMRGASIRTRKMAKDVLLFWKRVDKEMAEVRKREEREAAEALKREQEIQEERRQQRRLNFLIQHTEFYCHFMQNKQNSQPMDPLRNGNEGCVGQELLSSSSLGSESENAEDPVEAELREEALKVAREAVSKQKKIISTFDAEYTKLRLDADAKWASPDASVSGSADIDLHNPSTMPVKSTVQTPDLFRGCLKEYQLKGLQWLVNCYEQGLNGILADEMGLGKTIQAMVFLAHLAEEKNIWGPFLVVAPASVLNNWVDEINRFCPDLKALPYWGGSNERAILRKTITPSRLYRREAVFHILITSYQLLVQDQKHFRRVKWQYIVLDEAQAIKSSNSIRWKTLLSFDCRNRLLLTGTPIQNNMAELWALLHFIMPTLFDSQEQFSEWFSKGIQNHAEHGGALNEHQLNRLHAILKPFMLRRIKKDVVSELTRKTEITVHCKLSSRQQAFYQAVKNKISLAELFDSNRGHLNEKKIMNLMNIVIQLRKVCNHPELFERNEGITYLYFGKIPNSLLPPPFGELENIYYSGTKNPILYKMPKLVFEDTVASSEVKLGILRHPIQKYLNVFSPNNIFDSVFRQGNATDSFLVRSGTFGFTHLMNFSPAEVAFVATSSLMSRLLFFIMGNQQASDDFLDWMTEGMDDELEKGKVRTVSRMLFIPSRSDRSVLRRRFATGPAIAPFESLVVSHEDRLLSNFKLLHSSYTFIPKARASPICVQCSDRNFAYKVIEEMHHPWVKRVLIGFARTSEFNGPRIPTDPRPLVEEIDLELPILQPALQLTYRIFGSSPPVQTIDSAKLFTDSGKLQTLDILLKRLRAENHRVLLFAQMTKMLNILEDYMNYRKYRYLRLDGSSTIMDRRDMVRDFQHRSDIFVFLLSTRAGGLGINLTAADTVIFYESDWNPTLDLQAMDRAHRLGQTKDVTVYRLICKETVEEKILQRASQKSTVQQLVMTGGHVQGDLLAPEDVVSLLLDDPQLEHKLREIPLQARDRQKRTTKAIRVDHEGDVTLEELTESGGQCPGHDSSEDVEREKSNNKKRKDLLGKQPPSNLGDLHLIFPDKEPVESAPNNAIHSQGPPKKQRRTCGDVADGDIGHNFVFAPMTDAT